MSDPEQARDVRPRTADTATQLALCQPVLISRIQFFAGSIEYIFLGGVNRAWRDAWIDEPHIAIAAAKGNVAVPVRSRRRFTSFAAAVLSPARLLVALDCDMPWDGCNALKSRLNSGKQVHGKQVGGQNGGSNKKSEHTSRSVAPMDGSVGHGGNGGGSGINGGSDGTAPSYGRFAGCRAATAHLAGAATLEFVRQLGLMPPPLLDRVFAWAATAGNLPVLRWARDTTTTAISAVAAGAAPAAGTPSAAAPGGWGRGGGSAVCRCAAAGGHLETLRWLKDEGCPWDEWTSSAAAAAGSQEALVWLRQNGAPWNAWCCRNAARFGHLELLQWARANGAPWDDWTTQAAGEGGHLPVLQWARQNNCPWDDGTTRGAASGGHLEVLRWARQQGCRWDAACCAAAAGGGHLEVLQWARANGCPWDRFVCVSATAHHQLDVLSWAHAHGCPCDHAGPPELP